MLVIEGRSHKELEAEKQSLWETKSILEHMDIYIEKGIEKKEAMKLVAKDRGISKREVYKELI